MYTHTHVQTIFSMVCPEKESYIVYVCMTGFRYWVKGFILSTIFCILDSHIHWNGGGGGGGMEERRYDRGRKVG